MAILDIHGNPLQRATLSEPQTARLANRQREFAGHPSRGLTPAKLASILEAAEQGDIVQQHELFMDMEEKDGHLYAEMAKRKRAILTVPWTIKPPRNARAAEKRLAAEIEEMIRDIPNIEDVLLDMMDGVGHGFSNLEIEWQRLGKDWMPKAITHRPQTWFQLDIETRTQLCLRNDGYNGEPLQPFGWIAHVHRAKSGYIARAGLCRVLSWPHLFGNYSIRDLAEFLEILGIPLRIGKYPSGASEKEKNTLLAAVVSLGHNAAGIMPESMAIEIMEAAKGSHDPFMAMKSWSEMSMSKAILGGTLTSQADGKSSTNALGNVHNEVRHDILEADARQVAGSLTGTLVHYLVALNKGGLDPRRMPAFDFDTSEPEDLALFADALPKLADAGAQIPVSWVSERLKFPLPKEGEAVLGRAPVPAEPAQPTKPAINRAALSAGPENEPDAQSNLADRMGKEAAPFMAGLIEEIGRLAESAESPEALQAAMVAAYGHLDTADLERVMALGFAASELAGMVEARADAGDA